MSALGLIGPIEPIGPMGAITSQESPRLRTRLPNGAVILVERMAEARTLSVQLFASSKRAQEIPANHGQRHLLEHLIAEGPDRNLDARLESNGCLLLARTHRDAMQFEITGNAAQLDLALDAISSTLQPLKIDKDRLAREVKIITQEVGLLADPARLSSAAWRAAYGDAGLDPQGTVAGIGAAAIDGIAELQKRHFAPDGLVLVISGPVDLEQATNRAKKILSNIKPWPTPSPNMRRTAGKSGRGEAVGAFGEARAILVKGYQDPGTVAALAVALALAAQFEDSFVIYTPSVQNGLVIVGKTDDNSGLGLKIDSMSDGSEAALYAVGKTLARAWVERQIKTPSGSANIRGLLLSQGEAQSPELMLEAIDRVTQDDFRAAFYRIRKDSAVIAVGVKN